MDGVKEDPARIKELALIDACFDPGYGDYSLAEIVNDPHLEEETRFLDLVKAIIAQMTWNIRKGESYEYKYAEKIKKFLSVCKELYPERNIDIGYLCSVGALDKSELCHRFYDHEMRRTIEALNTQGLDEKEYKGRLYDAILRMLRRGPDQTLPGRGYTKIINEGHLNGLRFVYKQSGGGRSFWVPGVLAATTLVMAAIEP
jgi:hypothetical protein